MTGRRLRAIVCGTTFGQFYLKALAALPEQFELVGVLAKGSDRSVACAERFGVPLFTEPDALPDDVDLACVVLRSSVMGGAGTDLSLRLMDRGINVLQEQPVHADDLATCLRAARRNGVHFRVGDLYVHLPAVRRFADAARTLLARQPAEYIDASCSVQVAFPMLHILGECLGSLRPWRISAAGSDPDTPLLVLTGQLAGAPLILRVHNHVDPADPDNHLPLLHQATIGTAGGRLTLTDTHGPVTWSPRLHIPEPVKQRFDFADTAAIHLNEPSTTILDPSPAPSYERILSHEWPTAIQSDLLAMRSAILGESDGRRPDQYLLTLCRMWQDVTAQLGYPVLRPGQHHQPFPVRELATTATAEDVTTFTTALDEAVLSSMLLARHNAAHARHRGLVERWSRVLDERGWAGRKISTDDCMKAWDRATEAWNGRLGSIDFIEYLRLNAERLPQLMSGDQQAALLLFPEGRIERAFAVYHDTAIARYLNAAIAARVQQIVAAHAGPGPLRILEVGAGTGATTEDVASALGAADYCFTDLSKFFLDHARERFGRRYPWIRYEVLDVDADLESQGFTPGSAEIVIAAGVLNNAKDTGAALRRLRNVLIPGGWLFVTEPTREHLEILISQAFMMTTAEDARMSSGATFHSRREWLAHFADAGFDDLQVLPDEDHPLAPLGQRLFAARSPQ